MNHYESEIDFIPGPPGLTSIFLRGPASFAMRRSSEPVGFGNTVFIKLGKEPTPSKIIKNGTQLN